MSRFICFVGIAFLQMLLVLHPDSVRAFGTDPPTDSSYFSYVLYIPGHYVNDHCLIQADGIWHLFFTEGDMSIRPWLDPGNEVVIAHATSSDLINWTVREPALRVGPSGALDAGHLYAPNVIESDGTYYMIYTGNERNFNAGEHLFLARSKDLFTWTRYSSDPLFQPDSSWASYFPPGYDSSSGGPASGRDPFILKDSAYGYICYYVARLKADSSRPAADQEFSCVAAATSTDLIHWQDRGPVLTRRTVGYDTNSYAHPESPCVVEREGLYYLFWKGGAGTRYVISENPLDFHDRDEYFLATSHASKIFQWEDRWYITSCSRSVNDVTHTLSDRTRGMYLARLNWATYHPSLAPLNQTLAVDMPVVREDMLLYPNPVTRGERVHLKLVGRRGGVVRVTDVVGREWLHIEATDGEVRQDIPGNVEIDTAALPPGIYILRVDGSGRRTKFIVR